MEKEIEGFYSIKSFKNTTEGPVEWLIDWYSRSSKYSITYVYDDDIYYVGYSYTRLSDVADDHKFKDLDAAVEFVREKEQLGSFEESDEA